MLYEIFSAVNHITHFLKNRLDTQQLFLLKRHLESELLKKYQRINDLDKNWKELSYKKVHEDKEWVLVIKSGSFVSEIVSQSGVDLKNVIDLLPECYTLSIRPKQVLFSIDSFEYFVLYGEHCKHPWTVGCTITQFKIKKKKCKKKII